MQTKQLLVTRWADQGFLVGNTYQITPYFKALVLLKQTLQQRRVPYAFLAVIFWVRSTKRILYPSELGCT